jgi:hypothetical protein
MDKREEPKPNNHSSSSGQNVQHGHNISSVQVGSFLLTRSEEKLCGAAKKKLCGDCVKDEEDSLPSPLAQSTPTRFFGAPVSPAAAEHLTFLSTAAEMVSVVGIPAKAALPFFPVAAAFPAISYAPARGLACFPIAHVFSAKEPITQKNLFSSFTGNKFTLPASKSASPHRLSSNSSAHALFASPRQEDVMGMLMCSRLRCRVPQEGVHIAAIRQLCHMGQECS